MARNRKRAKERRARRPEPVRARGEHDEVAPAPIAHAAPDVELAEAQLALGRPEPDPEPESDNGALEQDEAAELEDGLGEREAVGRGAELAPAGAAAVGEPHPNLASRLIAFLQGSWRELQRVQWPDRRQVMQATGVVIGFVIVAGLFLGAADYVASQIVKLILK